MAGAKLTRWHNTLIGPYPGRTYEQEAAAVKHALFAYSVAAKIDSGKCNHCCGPASPDYTFCSKRCYRQAVREVSGY